VHHRDYVAESGVVEVAADNRILQFQEKPAPGTELSHWVNAGVYVCQPAMLDAKNEYERDMAGTGRYAPSPPLRTGPPEGATTV
jgi:NDP-sugar pyrophosphorylase family protein